MDSSIILWAILIKPPNFHNMMLTVSSVISTAVGKIWQLKETHFECLFRMVAHSSYFEVHWTLGCIVAFILCLVNENDQSNKRTSIIWITELKISQEIIKSDELGGPAVYSIRCPVKWIASLWSLKVEVMPSSLKINSYLQSPASFHKAASSLWWSAFNLIL